MDPSEERRERKRLKEYCDRVGYVADSQYGIPEKCPCGGKIIHEVRGKDEYDTHPGKRFFSCSNYKGDGLHYRQPWVHGVEEEIEKLTNRVEEVEKLLNCLPTMNKQIESLEEQVKTLSEQVDYLTVRMTDLERLCFD